MKLRRWRAGFFLSMALLGLLLIAPVGRAQASTQWSLQITNLAGNTVSYTYYQLLAMPVTTVAAELDCEGVLVAAGNWSGVSLNHLLQQAGLDPAVAYLNFKAQDGYASTIYLTEAMNPYVIIAYELNGSPLPEVLRLVLPGDNGDLWIALITSVTMSASPANADQSGSTSTSSTALTSTQQQELVQPQSQPAKPNNETGTEPVAIPANVNQSAQKASTTRESNPDGSSFPVMVASGIALGATAALMAAGYLARPKRKSEQSAEFLQQQ